MRTHLTKGKKVANPKEKVDMHAYYVEKYKQIAAIRAKLRAPLPKPTSSVVFKMTRDTVVNNALVTDKLTVPNKLSLPATGYPGQIVYDLSTQKYWGWTTGGWSDFAPTQVQFERIGYPSTTIPLDKF